MGVWRDAALRRARPGPHRYDNCHDPFCDRFICQVFQLGILEGLARAAGAAAQAYAQGHADGQSQGRSEGFNEGYAAGEAAADNGGGE